MYYLHILLSCQTQNNNNNWWVSSNLAMRRWLCINVALLVGFYLSRKVEIPWCHISGTTNLPMSLGPSAMPIITLKFHFKYSCLAQGRIFINQHCVPCVKHHFHSLKYLQMVQWLAFVNTALLFIWQALESSIPVLLIHIVQYHCWCHLPQCSHNYYLHLCLPHHDPTQLAIQIWCVMIIVQHWKRCHCLQNSMKGHWSWGGGVWRWRWDMNTRNVVERAVVVLAEGGKELKVFCDIKVVENRWTTDHKTTGLRWLLGKTTKCEGINNCL